MKEEKKEPIFTRWDMFFLGICVGSVIGNALLYFILDFII